MITPNIDNLDPLVLAYIVTSICKSKNYSEELWVLLMQKLEEAVCDIKQCSMLTLLLSNLTLIRYDNTDLYSLLFTQIYQTQEQVEYKDLVRIFVSLNGDRIQLHMMPDEILMNLETLVVPFIHNLSFTLEDFLIIIKLF